MKALQRADRSEHDRQAKLAAEPAHHGVDLADVTQDTRPERDRVERHAVPAQRGLGFRPADDVVPVVLVEVLPGLGDDLVQIEQLAGSGLGVVDGGLIGIAFLHEGHTGRRGRAGPA